MHQLVKKACRFSIAAVLYATLLSLALARQTSVPSQASATHATARKLSVSGLPNLGEVTPTLYRGAQPTGKGFETLAKMGVNIVIDLRDGSEGKVEEKEVTQSGMKFVAIPWGCSSPKDDDFAKFLTVMRDNPDKKVFVHCRLGVDRTGMMVAAYRMNEQGWTPDEALREMRAFGFSSLHEMILCNGLSSYEQRFPTVVTSSPAFQNLRAAVDKPMPPPGPQP
jgi:protein tyrosine/serine phosphatase